MRCHSLRDKPGRFVVNANCLRAHCLLLLSKVRRNGKRKRLDAGNLVFWKIDVKILASEFSPHDTTTLRAFIKHRAHPKSLALSKVGSVPFRTPLWRIEALGIRMVMLDVRLHVLITNCPPAIVRTRREVVNKSAWTGKLRHSARIGLTAELSDAGGQWRPKWKLPWPARVRSSDFVSLG